MQPVAKLTAGTHNRLSHVKHLLEYQMVMFQNPLFLLVYHCSPHAFGHESVRLEVVSPLEVVSRVAHTKKMM